MSAFEDATTVARVLEAGASGFVPKTHTGDQLIEAIRQTAAGEVMLPTGYAKALIQQLRLESEERLKADLLIREFTTRELEVLTLLSKGMTTQEIALALFVSRFTIRGHIRGILKKLDVHSMAQAVALAFELGIVAVMPHEDSVPTLVPAWQSVVTGDRAA